MENHYKGIIEGVSGRVRLLDYVINRVPTITTRNGAKKAIKSGAIKVNGRVGVSGEFVVNGQEIIHEKLKIKPKKVFELDLDIIYEDDYLAVVFKPAGIATSGNYFQTLENALPFNLKESLQPDSLDYPLPVHRLDKPTSGIVIVSKSRQVQVELNRMFQHSLVKKEYHAIVAGEISGEFTINDDIDGKEAVSVVKHISTSGYKNYGNISLVKLNPQTGRTHQLRKHLSGIGNPIIGDREYTLGDKLIKGRGMFLCATAITFSHPIKKEVMSFRTNLPNKFLKML